MQYKKIVLYQLFLGYYKGVNVKYGGLHLYLNVANEVNSCLWADAFGLRKIYYRGHATKQENNFLNRTKFIPNWTEALQLITSKPRQPFQFIQLWLCRVGETFWSNDSEQPQTACGYIINSSANPRLIRSERNASSGVIQVTLLAYRVWTSYLLQNFVFDCVLSNRNDEWYKVCHYKF